MCKCEVDTVCPTEFRPVRTQKLHITHEAVRAVIQTGTGCNDLERYLMAGSGYLRRESKKGGCLRKERDKGLLFEADCRCLGRSCGAGGAAGREERDGG